MRVIAGKKKSLTLKTVQGLSTRPTTDRIKETLFNMLNPYLYEARFLDVFAGSGGIGIEALSRGASYCCFIEKDRRAAACIRENLKKTDFTDISSLEMKDARNLAFFLAENEPYDIVFMDPPYDNGLETEVMEALRNSSIIKEDTLFVIEASIKTDFSQILDMGFECIKEKLYKTNKHVFLKKK